MLLAEIFDRGYVISLPQRKDRRSAVSRELAGIGCPLVPGRLDFFDAIRPESAEGFSSIGTRGCFLSHLSVLKIAREQNIDRLLVLEDDATFGEAWRRHGERFIELLSRQPWDLVHVGHIVKRHPQEGPVATVELKPVTGDLVGLQAYLIRPAARDSLIEFLEVVLTRPPGHPEGGAMHVDGAINMWRRRHPERQCLMTFPSLVGQRLSSSDVAKRPWLEQFGLVRRLADTGRLLMGGVLQRRRDARDAARYAPPPTR